MAKDNDLLSDLFRAYYDARRHKRNSRSQLEFEMDLEHNLIELYEQIRDRTYCVSPCICFVSDYPVKREIFASPFRDRVVHHLLYNYLSPIFEKRMIFDSYSCRKNKGTSQGIDRFEHHIRSCTHNYTRPAYILKLDLKGYFMSIDKKILYEVIWRSLRSCCRMPDSDRSGFDAELVDFLLWAVLFRNPVENCRVIGPKSDWDGIPASKCLSQSPPGVGLPIGDLTSQLFSNIYLNELDQYVKRVLQCRHYGRYVDDFYIVHTSRTHLRDLIPRIREFLATELHLTLHPDKIVLQHYTRGVAFLGSYVKPYRRYPIRRTVVSFRHAIERMEQECRDTSPTRESLVRMRSVINSYCGYFHMFKSYRILDSLLKTSSLNTYFQFTHDYRKARLRGGYETRPDLSIGSMAGSGGVGI